MSDWEWNEKGVAKKRGGRGEGEEGWSISGNETTGSDNLSMDDSLRLLERSSLRSW